MSFPNHKYSNKRYTFASNVSIIIITQPEIYSSTNFINDIFIFMLIQPTVFLYITSKCFMKQAKSCNEQHNCMLICTHVFQIVVIRKCLMMVCAN